MDPVFRDDVKVVILRRFAYEHMANIYAAKLNDEGIPCFLSNSTVGSLIPLSEGSFILHVAEKDLQEAREIMKIMDEQAQNPVEQDYRDASLEDIEYAKTVHLHEMRMQRKEGRIFMYVLILLAMAVAVVFVVQKACTSTTTGQAGQKNFNLFKPAARISSGQLHLSFLETPGLFTT